MELSTEELLFKSRDKRLAYVTVFLGFVYRGIRPKLPMGVLLLCVKFVFILFDPVDRPRMKLLRGVMLCKLRNVSDDDVDDIIDDMNNFGVANLHKINLPYLNNNFKIKFSINYEGLR